MRRNRHVKLALLFGAYSAGVAVLVNLAIVAIMGGGGSSETLLSSVVLAISIFLCGVLTVLVVWPRIGFDPFDSHKHGGA